MIADLLGSVKLARWLGNAVANGAFLGHYHWILQRIVLPMVTESAFALLGFAPERVANPRLMVQ